MADKPGWLVSLSLAAVGIVGALAGNAFQHFSAVNRESSTAFQVRQADAYVAFLNAFDKSRMSQQAKDKREAAELMKQYELEAGAAVRRIAIFGDKQVVEALAKWYRSDTLRPCEDLMNAELATWQAMRDTALRKGQEVSRSDLAAVAGRCSVATRQ